MHVVSCLYVHKYVDQSITDLNLYSTQQIKNHFTKLWLQWIDLQPMVAQCINVHTYVHMYLCRYIHYINIRRIYK